MVHEFWQVVVVLVLPFSFEPRGIKYIKKKIRREYLLRAWKGSRSNLVSQERRTVIPRCFFLDYHGSKTITYEMWSKPVCKQKNHRPDGKISRLPGAAIWQERIPCDSTKQRTLSVLLAESPWWHHACVSQGKSKHTTHTRARRSSRDGR